MNIGWLEDQAETLGYKGGAEIDADTLKETAPHEITIMPPGEVEPGMDAYVVGNCAHYTPEDVAVIDRPIVKVVNDAWTYGDPLVRDDLTQRAVLTIFRSPIHRRKFEYRLPGDTVLVPSQVDMPRFRAQAARPKQNRAVWCANVLGPQRVVGLTIAYKWAGRKGISLDAYGHGTPLGPVDYHDVPELLGGYRWYVHSMGKGYEPFGRATVEAWAAGCNLAVPPDTGALYWIHQRPKDLERCTTLFWQAFDKKMGRCLSLAS
jgi:hypothetical protein